MIVTTSRGQGKGGARNLGAQALCAISAAFGWSAILSVGEVRGQIPESDELTNIAQSQSVQSTLTSSGGADAKAQSQVRRLLLEQIDKLSSPSFRARELAVWSLQQEPDLAIALISEKLPASDLNGGSQMIDLLSKFAIRPEMSIGVAAMKSLEDAAQAKPSALALLAKNSLQAIADLQEAQAEEILTHLGADIGALKLMINGAKQNMDRGPPVRIMLIDKRFTGSPADIARMRFLQHVDAVYLHQIRVDGSLVRAMCQMPNLRSVVMSRTEISADDLALFRSIKRLDHFEMAYVPIGDDVLPILAQLPIWGSIRLFGTQISHAGREEIKKDLDGLNVYVARGGFLGVATGLDNLVVTLVQPDSAAKRAGLQVYDKITHVNAVPIKTFDDLREQLAYFQPGQRVQVTYLRDRQAQSADVELGEQPAEVRDP